VLVTKRISIKLEEATERRVRTAAANVGLAVSPFLRILILEAIKSPPTIEQEHPVQVELAEHIHTQLKEAARKTGSTMADFVRAALKERLPHYEEIGSQSDGS